MTPLVVPDTAPIRPEERLDEPALAAYLRRHLPEIVGEAEISFDQFPGGAANLTYRAVAGGAELVIRRAPLGPVAAAGHDMAREHRVLSRLWRAYPLAPRAYLYCDDPAVIGKPFVVMERRRGWVVRDSWPPGYDADPRLRRRLAGNLVAALADLHRIDPETVGLEDLGRPDGFVTRQIDGWSARWDVAATRSVPDMHLAVELLRATTPSPQAVAVLHNDFKLDNTMVGDRGGVVAVLDWDMATLGDPLVDVGTLLAYWVDPDGPTYPIFGERAVTLAPSMPRGEVIAAYGEATGLDLSAVRFYEGLALYRIAVIIEQIYSRFVEKQTTDPRFARFEPIAPILAAAAVDTLRS
jgi:aminoglycoside phosphotransferase (APT) family kinase protein